MKANNLKSLQVELAQVDADIAKTKLELNATQSKYNNLNSKRARIIEQIANSKKQVSISEHALLRLCERKFGLPIDKMEEELLKLVGNAQMDCTISIGDGLKAVIKNKTVVTITE